MSTRTTPASVTFTRPFALSALDGEQPAGTYQLVTEEESIDGLSFVACRRTATMLHLPSNPVPRQTRQVVEVDPEELASLLAADAAAAR
ncbi:MAG: hypothetical protein IBJ17_14255 [Reyranella sp.]|nr:hypothetical protein [Reyranella sp.]